jgi:hypothetical protein
MRQLFLSLGLWIVFGLPAEPVPSNKVRSDSTQAPRKTSVQAPAQEAATAMVREGRGGADSAWTHTPASAATGAQPSLPFRQEPAH